MRRLEGLLLPVATTFDDRGDLDLAGFASNLAVYRGAGVAGIVTAGSTGEAALLDDDERIRLVETAASTRADDWVIAGTGSESTRQTVRRSRDAARAGAAAVMVVAPHYYGAQMTEPALEAHYRRVADDSPVPVVLYNIPKYAHFALPPGMVARLAGHENVIGIKDSSGDAASLRGYLAAQSASFSVLTGSGAAAADALKAGARGAILAVALFAAELAARLVDAAAAGDHEEAARLQQRLAPLARRIVGDLGVAGIKAAMDETGLVGGPVRAPLRPLDGTGLAEVRALLRAAREPALA